MLTAGMRLGPYEIVSLVGSGGMGEVYRATDARLRRDVAIKVLPAAYAGDPERLPRFEQEALAAAALNHPNILAVYDIGTQEGKSFVVSELLEGETLRATLSEGPLPSARAVDYAIQIANGLAAAHDKGIVHRDLKPENLFITRDGRIKILDFGIAKLIDPQRIAAGLTNSPTTPPATLPGAVIGTVGYMSPEQVRGQPTDHRADIFALGCVLCEMLSGEQAFKRDTAADTMSAILKEEPVALSPGHANLPPGVATLVRRCLEKAPDQRFQSAKDVAFAIAAVGQGADRVALPSPLPARERRLWAAAVGALVTATALLGYAQYRAHQPAPVRTHLRIAIPLQNTVAYEIGTGIVDVLRQTLSDVDVTPVSVEGGVAAVKRLDAGEADLGFTSNLVAFHSVKTDRVLGHRTTKLAAAAIFYSTPAQIVVRKDAPVTTLQGLRGKRVSLGLLGALDDFSSEILLSHFGLGRGDLTIVHSDLEPSLTAVLDESLDAYIAWRGVPLPAIARAMATDRLRLVALDRESLEGLRLNHPFLLPMTIPKGVYQHLDASVSTVSTKMILIASTSVPAAMLDNVLRAVATHIPDLIARHPLASEIDLKKRPTVTDGMSIELHPGAEMFFQRVTRP